MFGIRRKARPEAQRSATRAQSIFEHPADFILHHSRTHGVSRRHKILLAATLASRPPLSNALPTQAPRRSMQGMIAGGPARPDARPTQDEASVARVATPEAAAGDAPWDSSSRA
jgi:hypothetical protein